MYYTNSDIKGTIESWYSTNITGNDNAKVVEGNYFCEAAKVKRDNGWNSGGNTNNPSVTEYTPNLTCITDGNSMGLLNLKVGLLTYEEYCYAGGHANNQGTSLYLWDNTSWWTMSPMGYLNNGYVSTAGIGVTLTDGRIYLQYPHGDNLKTRPVINLDKDVTVTGTGTSTDPYVVE